VSRCALKRRAFRGPALAESVSASREKPFRLAISCKQFARGDHESFTFLQESRFDFRFLGVNKNWHGLAQIDLRRLSGRRAKPAEKK
jgi:hypothetical protein